MGHLRSLLLSATLLVSVFTEATSSDLKDVRYDSLNVYSKIVERFSTTTVRSTITNVGNQSRELIFTFKIPKDDAFISKLTMSVGGKEYRGAAREKAKARQEYVERSNRGENVGLVESRGTELFQVSLNAAPMQQATFELEYQQLLTRYQSKYRLDLNINPGKVVDQLTVTIQAFESQGINPSSVNTSSEILTQRLNSSGSTVNEISGQYIPSASDQLSSGKDGLAKDIFFEYDVTHSTDDGIGQAVHKNGHFSHFFSPGGLPKVGVNIVFVIDVSGSMHGSKMAQAIESLIHVIGELDGSDYIGIVRFESSVSRWRSQMVLVQEFRSAAVLYAGRLVASGGTNLNGGLQAGISLLKTTAGTGCGKILVLLTDGQPTSGEINPNVIVSKTIETVGKSGISVNCLGFGNDLDYNLLERLSLNNNGVTRRIYIGSDATDQLQGFYKEISSPVLCDVNFDYSLCQNIEYTSTTSFSFLFAGGEIVVVGKFANGMADIKCPVTVSAKGRSSTVLFRGTISTMASQDLPMERLVAYQRIKQLLSSRKIEGANVSAIEGQALELALTNNFVTELTSLIVVQGGNYTNDTADPFIGEKPKPIATRPQPSSIFRGPSRSRLPVPASIPSSVVFSRRLHPLYLATLANMMVFRIASTRTPYTSSTTPPTTPPATSDSTNSTTPAPRYPLCSSTLCKRNRHQICTIPLHLRTCGSGCVKTSCNACYWADQERSTQAKCQNKTNCVDAKIRKFGLCVKKTLRRIYRNSPKAPRYSRNFKCLCPQ